MAGATFRAASNVAPSHLFLPLRFSPETYLYTDTQTQTHSHTHTNITRENGRHCHSFVALIGAFDLPSDLVSSQQNHWGSMTRL